MNLLSLALCVSKLPHINIVDFFITRSITSNKFVLSSLNQEIHILAIFNLVQLSYILSIALLNILSVRQKVPKNSAHGKNLHKRPLLTPHIASPRSGVCSSLQASACFQGAAELDLHGYTRKVIPAQIFKQSSHNGLKTSALALDFSTVPIR